MIADLSMPQESHTPKRQYRGECHDYCRNGLQETGKQIR